MRIGRVFTLFAVVTLTLWLRPGMVYAQEADISTPRVPPDQLEAAKAMENPLPPTPENIAKGKQVYEGKGTCFTCHGMSGKGDGPGGQALTPAPRDFTDPKFHQLRSDGEMFWVIKNGIDGTGMISYHPAMITDEETWQVILYEKTFNAAKQ